MLIENKDREIIFMKKIKYLPDNFENLALQAVEKFWAIKLKKQNNTQGGTRNSVLSGKHMDGFTEMFIKVARNAGAPEESIITKGPLLTLPGYFRATKNWDGIVYHQGKLIAAVEFKSQVGSFANNQNNRIEEALGLGVDFWAAEKHGILGNNSESPQSDPRPPFVGYLMLLEDAEESRRGKSPKTETFPVDQKFIGASYADRYLIATNRLVSERVFNSVSIMLSEKPENGVPAYNSMSTVTSVTTFFQALAAHIATHINE